MTAFGWLQIALFAALVGLLTRPLGGYLARVYGGERTLLQPLFGPLERALYRIAGNQPESRTGLAPLHGFFFAVPCGFNHRAVCAAPAAIRPTAQPARHGGRLA